MARIQDYPELLSLLRRHEGLRLKRIGVYAAGTLDALRRNPRLREL
jgi:hypothetical protein